MKKPQVGANKSKDTLQQQFIVLQQEWDMFKQSNPRHPRRSSIESNTTSFNNNLQLMNNSPISLMSCLQQRSPYVWKSRNNNMVNEIIRERWEAIESGKLKGRRLFGDLGGETEMGLEEREEISSECCSELVQESEDAMNGDCGSKGGEMGPVCGSCSGSSLFLEMTHGEKVAVEKFSVGEKKDGAGAGKLMVCMVWFAIVIMLYTIAIISTRCNGGYDEVTLVPT